MVDMGAKEKSGLDNLDLYTTPTNDAKNFRRIIAARENLDKARKELQDAVADARAAGESWTVIGRALGVTRQAAQQRFKDPTRVKTEN